MTTTLLGSFDGVIFEFLFHFLKRRRGVCVCLCVCVAKREFEKKENHMSSSAPLTVDGLISFPFHFCGVKLHKNKVYNQKRKGNCVLPYIFVGVSQA
jgi:hypothetical protein